MGNQRRHYKHGDVCFVTNRLAVGLPFVPNSYVNHLLHGALARAAALHPGIVLCAFEFLQNHYHLIVYIKETEVEMKDFLHDLNDELARIAGKLQGKRNHKFWAQRPHVAIFGSSASVIEHFGYCFLNSVKANFCERASEWIGVNSHRFLFSQAPEIHKWLPTKKQKRLPNKAFTKKEIRRLTNHFLNTPGHGFELNVDPFIWKSCFEDSKQLSDNQITQMILQTIEEGERVFKEERRKNRQKLAIPEQLMLQNPHKYYKPKKYSRRCYCLCTDPEMRCQMLEAYKDFCEKCVLAWNAWKKGDYSVTYPPSAFLPPRPPLCSALPSFG